MMIEEKMRLETVGELFVRRMDDLELSAAYVAEKLSFKSPNIVSMIRSGRMRIPVNRVVLAAKLFQVDLVYMLRLLAQEMKEQSDDDRLLEVLGIALGQEPLTEGELEIADLYRKFTCDRDIVISKEFPTEFEIISSALQKIQMKVKTNIEGYAERRRKVRRGPQPGAVRSKSVISITD